MHEADEPDVLVGLLDADGLSGEHGTEIDLALLVADTPAGGDDDGLVVKRIIELGRPREGRVDGR